MARKTGSHSEITGPKIKQTALKLFARYGFAAVSMRKIASEVGVQAGAIYNYTPDKQGLLFDLLYGHMEDLLTSWHLQNVSQDPIAALDHFVGFHLDFHICRPDLVFISYMELRNLNPNNFIIIEDLRGNYENIICEIITKGISDGIFKVKDPKITSFAIIAMLTGVVDWFRSDGVLTEYDLKQHYSILTRQMLGVNGPA